MLNDKLCNMDKCDMDDLRADVKEIKSALLGDEFNRNGLVSRVEKTEEKIKLHERYIYLISGGVGVIIFLSQFITSCK